MAGGSIVGIDVGSQLIKVVEMRRAGGGVDVTALELAPTPTDAVDNGLIIDAKLLGQAIKDLLKKAHVSAGKSVSSISGQSVVVRVIELPQVAGSELDSQMQFEAERQVPFQLSESIMDYAPIPRNYAEGDMQEVLLAVAQSELVDKHVEALFEAGLKPEGIDVEPLAVGRALLELGGIPERPGYTVAIVNIGASNTDIGIYRDKLLSFPRSVPLAGDQLTRSISDYMQVDLATAESYKREYGEVLFEQLQSAPTLGQQGDAGFGGAGMGFQDFSQAFDTPPPSTAGSGNMPFDFSSPGDAPTFNTEDVLPAPTHGTAEIQGTSDTDELQGGFSTAEVGAPFAFGDTAEQSGFFTPSAGHVTAPIGPTGGANMPASTGDPQRDALRVQVFNCIAPILSELVQEIRRSVDYYRGRSGDAQIDEILLTGGSAKLGNLAKFVEQEFNIPTRVANPFQYVQVSSKTYSPEHLNEISSLFSIALGLGCYSLLGGAKKRR